MTETNNKSFYKIIEHRKKCLEYYHRKKQEDPEYSNKHRERNLQNYYKKIQDPEFTEKERIRILQKIS